MNQSQVRFQIQHDRRRSSLLCVALRLAALSLILLPLLVWGKPQVKRKVRSTKPDNPAPAAVQRVKLLLNEGTPALEIVTTAPVNPQISKLENAMRLVIDFPNTNMSVPSKLVPIKSRYLTALRLNLQNTTPPMVHVEVDFKVPLGYTWDSAGNRLRVSFHNMPKKDVLPQPAAATGEIPTPVSAKASDPEFDDVVPTERLTSGASITADSDTTVLRLKHGGDVYVCPHTTVSLVHSKNGPDLMLAISGGALETHLTLQNSADEVVTPDFRILLRGPGVFQYAIRADSRGNTCVRSLPGNTASAIIYELMGDGKFEVLATDQFVFHDGHLSAQDTAFHSGSKQSEDTILPVECGCPPPSLPRSRRTLLASTFPEREVLPPNPSSDTPSQQRDLYPVDAPSDPRPDLGRNEGLQVTSDQAVQIPGLSQSQPHLSVEASLSFTPNPGMVAARYLPISSRRLSLPLTVLPPSPILVPKPHKTVLGRIKAFFSRVIP
jgi:AMIN domain-containing protein